VDVVFIVDESLSMGPEIAAVTANINFIATALEASLDPQYALLGFAHGSLARSGATARSTPAVIRTDFTNAAGLATATALLRPDWGAFEAGAYATSFAMNNLTGWRPGAGACVVLITDEDNDGVPSNTTANQTGNRDQAKIDLDARGAVFFGIVPGLAGNSERDYGPNAGSLAAHTGGGTFVTSSFVSNPQPVLDALLTACRIAVTQGINLIPGSATNPVGTDHTVTAIVSDSLGNPVVGTSVTFDVVVGPNAGGTGSSVTNSFGEATFTYTSNGTAGIDEIQASFVDDAGATQTSIVVYKEWVAPAGPTCDGLAATIIGTPGDDDINGTPGNDVIVGLGGEDNIDGKGGNDVICGGPDHDQLEGGDGNDRIFGDGGPDRIWGQDGEDYIEGGADNDVVYGGDDNDEIHGNGGNDRLKGDNGDDNIFGEDGNDTVDGKSGEDYLDGGANDDRLYGGDDNDTMVGGDGYNVYYGGAGDDSMLGGADRDRMKGEAGTDTCDGAGGLLDSTETCEIVTNVP
jgi:Ca2+-binding RTX toxin-like protein